MNVLPSTLLGPHGDAAAEQLDELAREGQADAGTLARPAFVPTLELAEPVEDEVEVLRGDADPGVGDGDGVPDVAPAQAERDASARRELQGVREQVEHDALEHVDVDVGIVVELVADDVELETGALDGRAEVRGDPGHELLDVGLDPVRLHGARPRPW